MRKKIFFFIISLILLYSEGVEAQMRQKLEFEPGHTALKSDIQLRSSYMDGEYINTEVSLFYEMSSRELILSITPKWGSYDRVFMPMKVYGENELKSGVRRDLNGKPSMTSQFKRGLYFGIGPSVRYDGATATDVIAVGMKNEMFSVGQSLMLHLRVDNPEKAVLIKLSGISAVQLQETASGKIKYRFLYICDEMQLEVKVPVDPCKSDEVSRIASEANRLYNEVLDTHRRYAKAAGLKSYDECISCKEKFEKGFREQLSELKRQYNRLNASCPRVDKILDEIDVVFHDASTLDCQKRKPTPPIITDRPGGVAPTPNIPNLSITLANDVKKLEGLVNKVIGNRNDANLRKSCNELILEFEERVHQMDEKSKNRPDIRKTLNSFDNIKKLFLEVTK